MATCPRCHQSVAADAITCGFCRLELKAHGHPGIELHRSTDGYLCDRCSYHKDDSCTFPQRPLAQTCTLFDDNQAEPPATVAYVIPWWRRHSGWLLLGGLVLLSLLVALL